MTSLYTKEVQNSSYKVWDQNPLQPLPLDDVIKMYENGFAGAICSEEAEEELLAQVSFKYGSDVCDTFGFTESAAGQLIIPYRYIEQYYGTDSLWQGPAQVYGNCFLAGTPVTMADGSKKPIEQVEVGELVVTHKGTNQVYELVDRPYDDKLVEFENLTFGKSIRCTKDHVFPILNTKNSKDLLWKKASEIEEGEYLVLGRPRVQPQEITFDLRDYGADVVEDTDCKNLRLESVQSGECRQKHSETRSKRFIKFDKRLAYIIGAFLAEGACDKNSSGVPSRIGFCVATKEKYYQNKIIDYVKDIFDLDCTLYDNKRNATIIRVCSGPVANLIYTLCGRGNVYSKRPPWQALSLDLETKLALLQGWVDGDGYYSTEAYRDGKTYNNYKVVAVSASKELINGMQELANSCGLSCSINTRKAYKQSRQAYNLNFYGSNAQVLAKQENKKLSISENITCEYGIPIKITRKSYIPYTGQVYCVNVKDDHSFIANGFLTHNCVSESEELASLLTMCTEVASGQPDSETGNVEELPKSESEAKYGPIAWEPIYWFRGHNGHGWICAQAVQVSLNYCGIVPRINIEGVGDFRKTDPKLGTKYGSRKPPQEVIDKINGNRFRESTKIDSFEVLRDLLSRGFGVTTCGSEGWASTRDENGFSRRSGSWAHAMAIIGVDDRPEIIKKYGEPLVLIINSWGLKWNKGPRKIFGTNIDIPEGAFWAKWSDVRRRDMYALAGLSGWARKELPDLTDFSPGAV